MYAKLSYLEFLPGKAQEALDYIREKMFLSASKQTGFKDAFILQNTAEPQKYTLISLWKSLEEMQASRLPEHLYVDQQQFESLIATFSQDTHEVLFQFFHTPASGG